LIFLFEKRTTLERLDAEHVEEICRDESSLDALGRVATREVSAPPAFEGEMFERLALRLPVEIVRHRDFIALDTAARVLVPDCDDAIQIRKLQGLEYQSVDATKDGAVRADAQSQRDYSNRRKARTLDQVSDCIADITKERAHGSSLHPLYS
jgi:hypothetical protein